MERGRILIMGQTKESTYEIRNLLDNKRFELEIALSGDVGKNILSQRYMNLLILHTEALGEESSDFLQFLEERGLEIPVLILGEESARYEQVVPGAKSIKCFDKPYAVSDMLSTIEGL